MAANYAYNTRDFKFILKEWLPMEEIFSYDKYKDYYSKDDLDMLIDQVHKMVAEVIAPTNDDGEKTPVYFENGKVYVPKSFKDLYKYVQENGWGTSNIDEEAEGTLPFTLLNVVNEMINAANPAFNPYLVLTTGAAGLIQTYGDEHHKKMFLPKMMDGTWSGTMCLTEPTAGSDVGDILSKAYPTDDPRIYKIKGSKIFITGGDGDHVENIIHLYLARIEGAKPGTKGISLFIVPKYWVNEDGSLEPNDVETTGVEHKLGLKGSATAALSCGDNNGCRGWLLGSYDPETGEGQGMAQMFQMMNEERLNTGMFALSVAANAYWNAAAYCKERIQGRLMTNPKAGRTQIINHEDVKRMLLLNKATTEACRAIILKACYFIDVAHHDPDPERRKWASGKVECLTPIAKAYPSDEAWTLIGESIQAYGGYGYCEEYPVAQAARDCKIYSIWEGTNFIQSMDLVGRKWTMAKGAVFAAFLKDIEDFLNANRGAAAGFDKEFANLEKALASYREIQKTIAGYMAAGQAGLIPAYSRRILTATGQLYGGYCLLEQALIAKKRADELGTDHYDYNFYNGKVLSARYYLRNVVPNVWAILELVQDGDTSVIEAHPDIFQY
ncbi:MAG: acyl-CoA dehydrogenase [Syntrophomonadaceae bacterium]|nr:acyl-CoA dehydrogenase [Syntrophomonadaceae bacterium]